jgi:hypothetical protein
MRRSSEVLFGNTGEFLPISEVIQFSSWISLEVTPSLKGRWGNDIPPRLFQVIPAAVKRAGE